MATDNTFHGWAAPSAGAALQKLDFDAGALADDEVEVEVDYCGICHSDVSMIDNDWGMTTYPFVPGHEAVGRVVKLGSQAKGLTIGQRVGVGWNRGSCMHCHSCIGGNQHLCNEVQPTIVGRHGAFADRIRAHWAWAIALPEGIDPGAAGPLFCGGITVFAPLVVHNVKPTSRVGVIGIGGLGHMAIRFMSAWGCEVTAFTSSARKHEEARKLGAHHVVVSTDPAELKAAASSLDFLLVTANVKLDWDAIINTLAPQGRLHFVGAVPEPVPLTVFTLLLKQMDVSGSPTGSPAVIADMLAFCARHGIVPMVEHYPVAQINDALQHLRDGKARYRVVLDM